MLSACTKITGLILISSLCAAPVSQAANGTWNSLSSASWGDSTKWSSSTIADGMGFSAFFTQLNLVTTPTTVDLDTARTIGALFIGDTNTTDRQGYIFNSTNGSSLTLNNGDSNSWIVQTLTSGTTTMDIPLKLESSLDILNFNTGNSILLNGNISANSAGVKVLTLAGMAVPIQATTPLVYQSSTGSTTINGMISDGDGTVALNVDSSTGSTLILNGHNTFSGGTTLNQGILELNHINALGTGPLTINGGILHSRATARLTLAGSPIVFNGDFSFIGSQALDIGANNTITMKDDIVISGLGAQFSLYGAIMDEGNAYTLTKTGTGNLYLFNSAGLSNYSGGTIMEGGRLIVGSHASIGTGKVWLKNGSALAFNGAALDQSMLHRIETHSKGYYGTWGNRNVTANLDLSAYSDLYLGSISGTLTYTGTLTPFSNTYKLGGASGTNSIFSSALTGTERSATMGVRGVSTGTVTYNAENTYEGDTDVKGAMALQINGVTSGISTSSNINLDGNATFRYDNTGATAAISDSFGNLNLLSGETQIVHKRTANFDTQITFAGISRAQGATGNFSVTDTGSSATGNRTAFASNPTPSSFMDQGLFYTGTNYAAYDAAGFVRALDYSSDLQTSSASAGSNMNASAGTHVNLLGSISNQDTLSIQTLRITDAFNVTLSSGSTLTLSEGGILKAGGTESVISGGAITAGAQELLIRLNGSTDTLRIQSDILSSSTGGLTKSGAGLLILSGNNAYTGITTVNGGTLQVLGANAIGRGDIVLNGGTLNLRANTANPGLTNSSFESIAFGNNVYVSGDSTLSVGSLTGSNTNLHKTLQLGDLHIGGNTFTLSNTNSYGVEFTGTTTLSLGTFGNTTINVATARASNLANGLTLSGLVTGNSQLTLRGNGTLHLSNAANDFTGDIWVSAGVLSVSNDGALGNLNNSIKLMDATISSTFRATETFSTSRTIRLGNNTTNRNILQVVNNKTLTLNSSFDGKNGFLKLDNGTLAINADNSNWNGDIIIHDGVVDALHANALGSSAGSTQVSNIGSAVHLSANATFHENFHLNHTGINGTGALLSKAGNNALSGQIKLTGDTSIGVALGSQLHFTNASSVGLEPITAITAATNDQYELTLTGAGNGIIDTSLNLKNNQLHLQSKGTWTINETIVNTRDINVSNGTLILGGDNGAASSNTSAWRIGSNGTLVLDNSSQALDNRLGNRGIYLGGNLTIIGAHNQTTNETINNANVFLGNTHSTLTLDPQNTGTIRFLISGSGRTFSRSARGTMLIRGDNLGSILPENSVLIVAATAPTHTGQNGENGSTQKSILPWALADTSASGLGQGFATYDINYGMRVLHKDEQLQYLSSTSNINTTETKGALTNYQINSLHLSTNGGVETQVANTINIESGGILAEAGNTGIKGGILQTTSNREMIVHTLGNLRIDSLIANSTGGLTKTGQGELTLAQKSYYTGGTSINQGTLKLDAGHHTLMVSDHLYLNTGGTLDINGYHQTVGSLKSMLNSVAEDQFSGGHLVNTGANATFTINTLSTSTFNYAGTSSGDLNLVRSNSGIWVVTNELKHTGTTLLNGGITSLRNDGAITDSSKVKIQYAWLQLVNHLNSGREDRIGDDIDIEMSGGTIGLYGRPGAIIEEKLGNVHLASGLNVITSSTGSNNANVAPQASTLILKSLTRDASAGAVINFGQSYVNTSSEALGVISVNTFSSENIIVEGGLTVTNNIIGPWAIATNYYPYSSLEFVGYDMQNGVGALNTTGFAGYDATTLPTVSQPNHNVRITADATVTAGGLTIHTLNSVGVTGNRSRVISFANASDTLNLAGGAIAFSQSSSNADYSHKLGAERNQGRLTAGGTNPTGPVDFFVYYLNNIPANLLTLNSAIIDNPNNGGQSLRLILNNTNFGYSTIELASTLNSYTGGTLINNAAVQLSGNLGTGNIQMNGGTFTQLAGGTFASQKLTMNGTAVITLNGTNALKDIYINNNGASNPSNVFTTTSLVAPSIKLGAGGILNMEGNLKVDSSNVATTALITEGTLHLNGASRTIEVTPIQSETAWLAPEQASLNISSVIQGSAGNGIIKTGEGFLQLSANNTFTGGVNVQAGGLVIGHNSALGSGTLTLHDDTSITADASARTVTNAVTILGDFTIGVRGPTIPSTLTLSGAVNWGATNRNVSVNSTPSTVQTLSGQISGSGGITKTGVGTLAITGSNSATLNWTAAQAIKIHDGALRINSNHALGANPNATTEANIVIHNGTLSATETFTLDSRRGIALGDANTSGTGAIEIINSAHTLTYDGVIANNGTGAGSLQKNGAGRLLLGGANTYSGNTNIGSGTLALSANGSINNSQRISVVTGATFDVSAVSGGYQLRAGQTLEGGGNITGNTTILSGATLAPGTSVNHRAEKLTFTGILGLQAGSTTQFQLTTPTFRSPNNFMGYEYGSTAYNSYVIAYSEGQGEHDKLEITGTLIQESGAKIEVLPDDYTPALGQIFNLIDWTTAFNASSNLGEVYRDGSNDSMYDLDLPNISASGLDWDISLFASHGIIVVIPEPSKAMLLLMACAAISLRRRR